jgi:hypothetical protein
MADVPSGLSLTSPQETKLNYLSMRFQNVFHSKSHLTVVDSLISKQVSSKVVLMRIAHSGIQVTFYLHVGVSEVGCASVIK